MFKADKPVFKNKKQFYNFINMKLTGLICEEEDWLANLANASALLGYMLEDINWVGFYLYKNNELVLGPFQGLPACTHIEIGKGVCGTAAEKREAILVKNVDEFPGHIAAYSPAMFEIVIPLIKDDKLIGVLDIDSPIYERFSEDDCDFLVKFVSILNKYVNY